MRCKKYWIAMLPAALAACHGPSTTTNQASSNTTTAADLQSKLQSLPEASRNAVFLRAIRDASYDCQFVRKSMPHAAIQGRPAWTILCERDIPFVAVVNRDDYLQIVPAKLLEPKKS